MPSFASIDVLRVSALHFALLMALTCASCGGAVTAPDAGEQPGPVPAAQEDLEFDGPTIATRIPRLAPMVMMVHDVAHAADVLDRAGLAARYPDAYDVITVELIAKYGRDILSPEQLTAAGVNASGAFWIGFLDLEGEIGFMAVEIADIELLSGTLADTARALGATVTIETVNEASVQLLSVGGQRAWWVIHNDVLVVVLTGQNDDVGWQYARMLARLTAKDSLAVNQTVWETRGQIPQAEDPALGTLWFNVGEFAQNVILTDGKGPDDTEDMYAREQLAEARRRGDVNDIRYWEDALREQHQWAQERQQQRRGAHAFLQEVLVPINGIAVDFRKREQELQFSGFASASGESLFGQLATNAPGRPAILDVSQTAPLWMLHGNFDRARLLEVVTLFAAAERASLDDVRTELQSQVGLDLDSDIIETLAGPIGFGLWLSDAVLESESRFEELIEFAVVADLSDAPRMVTTLEKLFGNALMLALARRDGDRPVWRVLVPMYKTVHVGVVSDKLVVSTLEESLERVETKADPFYAVANPHPALADWTFEDPTAGIVLHDWAMTGAGMFLMFRFGRWTPEGQDPHPGVDWSEASRRAKEAFDARLAELETMRTEHAALEKVQTEEALGALGLTHLRGEAVDGGYVFTGGVMVDQPTIADAVGTIVQSVTALTDLKTKHQATQQGLLDDLYRLEEEFFRSRYQDYDTNP